ncbi:HTH-type transcriptional repressor CytR [compost metagenome]
MVAIKDVAKKANVSTATVSRALSKPESVSKKTLEKVLNVIEEMQYLPNASAQQLRMSRTKSVLVVVPDITNTFFSKVVRGIESVASEFGYQIVLGDAHERSEMNIKFFEQLHQKKSDGMILLTSNVDADAIRQLSQRYPIVLACEYVEGLNIPTVSINNIKSSCEAVDYLVQMGHRRIGTITGPQDSVLGKDRLEGFLRSLAKHQLEVDPLHIQEGDFLYEQGYECMNRILLCETLPTALFVANDEMAFGAINAIREANLKVPEDISIISFDNIKFASIFSPSLTTISQPAFEIGTTAMKYMIQLMNKEDIEENHYILPHKLIIRESVQQK